MFIHFKKKHPNFKVCSKEHLQNPTSIIQTFADHITRKNVAHPTIKRQFRKEYSWICNKKLTSVRVRRANHPMCCSSITSVASILLASCSAFTVSTCSAECSELNHTAASWLSAARRTQLCTPSGEWSSRVRFSETYKHRGLDERVVIGWTVVVLWTIGKRFCDYLMIKFKTFPQAKALIKTIHLIS